MSVKKYGIYFIYPPTIDLRAEGLGRHLTAFLKGAQARKDSEFIVACPSWAQQPLLQLCLAEGVDTTKLQIIGPKNLPWLLGLYERYRALIKNYLPHKIINKFYHRSKQATVHSIPNPPVHLSKSRAILSIAAAVITQPMLFIKKALSATSQKLKLIVEILKEKRLISPNLSIPKFNHGLFHPKNNPLVMMLYRRMEAAETNKIHKIIQQHTDIVAWYSPTAFSKDFNNITAPRLMCVPDVVLTDFPVGFSAIGGNRFLRNFQIIEQAIQGGSNLVTYSQHVKWHTLVNRYQVHPNNIDVVTHGANSLADLVMAPGLPDNNAASSLLCRNYLNEKLKRSNYFSDIPNFDYDGVSFLFYASQFRPNKNLITLLRAYEYLLRRRSIQHKLILTGTPSKQPEVAKFIAEHHLQSEVLCLPGLTATELAACYHLAELAVNPSLSEGGFPFTYTEALSVGTPVVMARIAVTEELLVDPELNEKSLFDPYDWRDMAKQIEWALINKAELYQLQRKFYDDVLVKRSWQDVVDDYINILDRISSNQPTEGATA